MDRSSTDPLRADLMADEKSPETPVPPSPALNTEGKPNSGADETVIVYQHSNLFYWWPVWAFGFLFAFITYLGDAHMAIVPAGTKAVTAQSMELEKGQPASGDILVLPEGKKHYTQKDKVGTELPIQPTYYVTRYRGLGTTFLFVLLIVIFITNITLRGLWSLVVLISLSMTAIIFGLAGWWEIIFEHLGNLSIFINLGGYLLLSITLFVLWFINFFIMDRQLYVVFTPGQVRLCLEIGGGEIIYDTFGMVFQKRRSDLFRHIILGFGSGDLVLRFSKVDHPVELHNILGINKILKRIERVVQEKVIISSEAPKPAPKA